MSITWWVDDREGRTRRLRSEKVGVYDRRTAPSELRRRLAAGLAAIDRWTPADLGPAHGPFKAWTEHPAGPSLPLR
ncbi:MAG: hypothetical protein E6H98_07455 [Chloroflexi bacterium]|nr:MAG: hypothetical protein E6H98_07455 [Chloroflexota bacterium]